MFSVSFYSLLNRNIHNGHCFSRTAHNGGARGRIVFSSAQCQREYFQVSKARELTCRHRTQAVTVWWTLSRDFAVSGVSAMVAL